MPKDHESVPDTQLDLFDKPEFLENSECDEDELKRRLAVKQLEHDTLMKVARAYDQEEDAIGRSEAYTNTPDSSSLSSILVESGFTTRSDLGERLKILNSELAEIRTFIEEAQVIDHDDTF